ncbi:MAG: hypothetical protein RBS39_03830 [Phycisphaerales bacterium]|jgi:hypothetical protein|nr:hypothetical protein [Phycisphaerales bacterium]
MERVRSLGVAGFAAAGIVFVGMSSGGAEASIVRARATADNHYAIFTLMDATLGYVGGNETGAEGSSGGYNWSEAEWWEFESDSYVYVAAWSDKSIAQGLLIDLEVDGEMILSGDPRWQVASTGTPRTTGDPHPLALDVEGFADAASRGGGWETPFVGGTNGIAPWASIASISSESRWMWRNVAGDDNPLDGGADAGEMLLFRIPVTIPSPGSHACLLAGAMLLSARRRAG